MSSFTGGELERYGGIGSYSCGLSCDGDILAVFKKGGRMTFSGLIAVYLFLGGTSAGAYAVLAVLDVASNMSTWNRHDERNRTSHAPKILCESTYQRIRRIVYGATLCILMLGVLCLIADLGRPDAFY